MRHSIIVPDFHRGSGRISGRERAEECFVLRLTRAEHHQCEILLQELVGYVGDQVETLLRYKAQTMPTSGGPYFLQAAQRRAANLFADFLAFQILRRIILRDEFIRFQGSIANSRRRSECPSAGLRGFGPRLPGPIRIRRFRISFAYLRLTVVR